MCFCSYPFKPFTVYQNLKKRQKHCGKSKQILYIYLPRKSPDIELFKQHAAYTTEPLCFIYAYIFKLVFIHNSRQIL
jgi:hypothetical protein